MKWYTVETYCTAITQNANSWSIRFIQKVDNLSSEEPEVIFPSCSLCLI